MATKLSDLLGESLIENNPNKGDEAFRQVPTSELDRKVVAIYFSAHWCPPCQAFTPILAKYYTKVQSELHDQFDVVFASSDHNEESFAEYFKTMPWKSIPYSDRDREKKLSTKFNVDGIPTLVVLSPDGRILTGDGGADVRDKGVEAIRLWIQNGQKPDTNSDEYLWPGATCGECKMNPLIGQRYKCSTCDNYDLCSECQKKGHEHELKIMPQTLGTIGALVWKGINLNSNL